MEIDDRENIQDILLTHNNFSLEKKSKKHKKQISHGDLQWKC